MWFIVTFRGSRRKLAIAIPQCHHQYAVPQIGATESGDDGIITNDKFCCTRYLHLRLRASHRPQSACNNSLQAVRQADKGGNHETCMDGAPPPSATDRCATALGSGVSTPAPVRRPVE